MRLKLAKQSVKLNSELVDECKHRRFGALGAPGGGVLVIVPNRCEAVSVRLYKVRRIMLPIRRLLLRVLKSLFPGANLRKASLLVYNICYMLIVP